MNLNFEKLEEIILQFRENEKLQIDFCKNNNYIPYTNQKNLDYLYEPLVDKQYKLAGKAKSILDMMLSPNHFMDNSLTYGQEFFEHGLIQIKE